MKTAACFLCLAAVVALLALNLVESVRIRKALYGECPVYHQKIRLSREETYEDTKRNMAEEEAMERQGYRYVGQHDEGGNRYLDFIRVSRTDRLLTSDEAEALIEFRAKQ